MTNSNTNEPGRTVLDAAQVRARLEQERARVSGLIDGLQNEGLDEEESAQSGELTHYDQHPADQASDTFEREKDLSILEGLETDLAEIEAALQRVDDGTYGIDEVTGEPIDPERLSALPTARTNISGSETRIDDAQ
jgi:RNA polymerase-binding transcription factor DksA